MYVIIQEFDVADSALHYETFARTSVATAETLRALDRLIFSGALKPELFILPPQEGSFLKRIGIAVSGALIFGAASVTILDSKTFQAFYEEMLGELPPDTARRLAEAVKSMMQHEATQEDCEFVLGIMQQYFIEEDNNKLRKQRLISPQNFPEGYLAKNAFYEACIRDGSVRGIRLPPFPEPIDRDQFLERRSLISKPDTENDGDWSVEEVELTVTSPNWDRRDNVRGWKGRDSNMRICYFRVEDHNFWEQVANRSVSSGIIDQMRAQIAYRQGATQIRNAHVIRVLAFNGVEISSAASGLELDKILDDLSLREARLI